MSDDGQAPVTEFRFEPASPGPRGSRPSTRTIALLAMGTAVLALVNAQFTVSRVDSLETQISKPSLFNPPVDLNAFIQKIQKSVVVIECRDSQGSGWVLDLGSPDQSASDDTKLIDKKFPTEVITNHHVIEECVDTPGKVRATAHGETYDAWLYSWDAENDLALVAIRQKVPALEVAREPRPGQWVMVAGAPYGLEGSISIGNVINVDETGVISTAPLNSGNSGGPLVNSRGRVVGTSSWSRIGEEDPQNWNVAIDIPSFCVALVDCEDDPKWTWT